jgi:hypothetical protein
VVDFGTKLPAENASASGPLHDRIPDAGVQITKHAWIATISDGKGHLCAKGFGDEGVVNPAIPVDTSAIADGICSLLTDLRAEKRSGPHLVRHEAIAVQAVHGMR